MLAETMIFIFTGQGKGKTSAAVGMGVRAAGAKRKVLMVQFLKAGGSSEIKAIKKIDNFTAKSFGQKKFLSKNNPPSQKDIELARKALAFAESQLKNKKCDFVILDELCPALYFKALSAAEVANFLKKWHNKIDIVVTGRKCPKKIMEMAELITQCREIKHYFKKGLCPSKGIDL